MSSIRFIHAADLHLDAPFQSIELFDEVWLNRLKNAAWDAFDHLIQLAIEKNVDFIILAGDIFDQESGGRQSFHRFRKKMTLLSSRGIHSYIVLGNHDLLIDHQTFREVMSDDECVHFFSNEKIETLTLHKGGNEAVHFYGRGFWDSDPEDNPTIEYVDAIDGDESDLLNIAIAHGRVGEVNELLPCPSFPLKDLKTSKVHYWAMGHMHKHRVFIDELPLVVNPGGIQGVSMNELGPMGCYYSEWQGSLLEDIQFFPLQKVRWEQLTFHFNENCDNCGHSCLASLEEVTSCIRENLEDCYRDIGKPLIVQLTLEGKTTEYSRLREKTTLDMLQKNLKHDSFIVAELIDHTIPYLSLDDSNSLKYILEEYISIIDSLKTDENLYEKLEDKHAFLYGNAYFQEVTRTGPNQRGRGQWKVKKLKKDRFNWLEEAKKLGIDTLLAKEGEISLVDIVSGFEKDMLQFLNGELSQGFVFDFIESFQKYEESIGEMMAEGADEEKITLLYQGQHQIDDELFQAVKQWTLFSIASFVFKLISQQE